MKYQNTTFEIGDLVRTCSVAELRASLSFADAIDAALLVRELEPFCNRIFQVARVSFHHFDEQKRRLLRLPEPLYLLHGVHCSGNVSDFPMTCERACLLFWRESWLSPAEGAGAPPRIDEINLPALPSRCQWLAAESILEPEKWLEKIWQKRIGLIWDLKKGLLRAIKRMTRSKNKKLTGGRNMADSLSAGDWVTIRSFEEIQHSLDENGATGGCVFTREMRQFCGQKAQVKGIVRHFYDDSRKRFVKVKSLVLLDQIFCSGQRRVFRHPCDRSCFYFWHPSWLRKLGGEDS